MGFEELKGQTRAIEILKAGFRAGRVAHAYLFYGPAGVGKKKAALIFSRLLNCEKPRDGEPCEVCPNCRKIKSGNHPDVMPIQPDGTAVKIAQIRALQERAYYKCYEAAYKIFIIDGADAMTSEAANSLLKTLEEPPAQTVFILLAEDKGRLPATILSRSQTIAFNLLDDDVITAILAEHGIIEGPPPGIARGSAGKALELLASVNCEELGDNVKKLLHELKDGGYHEILSWAEKAEKERDRVETMLELLAARYHELLHRQLPGGMSAGGPGDAPPGTAYSIEGCCRAIEEIEQAFGQLKNNANARLVLEVLLINLRNIEQKERGNGSVG